MLPVDMARDVNNPWPAEVFGVDNGARGVEVDDDVPSFFVVRNIKLNYWLFVYCGASIILCFMLCIHIRAFLMQDMARMNGLPPPPSTLLDVVGSSSNNTRAPALQIVPYDGANDGGNRLMSHEIVAAGDRALDATMVSY